MIAGYHDFLVARDGEPDLVRRTLSRRETFFAELAREPVRSRWRPSRETFLQNLARRRPEPGLDARMLWLLATAKANQAERFGVNLGDAYGKNDPDDPVRVRMALQEHYHTRILADVVTMFGLPVRHCVPPLVARAMVRLIIAVPDRWTLSLVGCAEMAGCVLFRSLRDRGVELFADEPAVAARIRLLYDEILGDEIGHVGYVTAVLGPAGRALMRGLYRAIALRLALGMPENEMLFGRADLARRFGATFRLDELVAEVPGRAYAAALP